MNNFSKYTRYLFLFFLLPIITLFLGVIAFKSNLFNYKPAIILSGSMEPTFSVDDLVFTMQTQNIKVGDIVSYYDDNGLNIMHRVVEVNGEEIITKGDANNTLDKAINKNQVVGVYTGKIKYIGKVFRFIKSPMGIMLCIILTIIVFIYPSNKNNTKKDMINESKNNEDTKITKILFLEAFYSLFLIGFIIAGYYAKYQNRFEGSDDTVVANWDNNIELLSEDTVHFQNGQNNTKEIQFNVTYISEVTATYDISLNNVSSKLGIELSNVDILTGIKQINNSFIIKINDTEENIDINTLKTNHKVISNNIEATYEAHNNQDVYTFKDKVSGKIIKAMTNEENNYNYSFINYGIFQINEITKKLHILKIDTLETELPNFDNLELFATFEQIN